MEHHNYTLIGTINGPALAAVLAIEMVIALIANTVVLIVTISKGKSWKLPSTVLFTSLIVAHLVMNLLFTLFSVISAAAGEWIFGSTLEQKRGTCTFVAYFMWYCVLIISMTLAVISIDRFLFIVKPHIHKQFMRPWVAVTLVTGIWLLAAILNSTPFFGFGEFDYAFGYGPCVPYWEDIGYIVYMLLIFSVIIGIIIITSIWTFCFTFKFIQDQSELTEDSVYSSRKKRLFGIFGTMLLVYGISFLPGVITGIINLFVDLPDEVYATALICFVSITVTNPLVQSYFRPDIKRSLVLSYRKVLKRKKTVTIITTDGKGSSESGV